jgi:hypothetical protein
MKYDYGDGVIFKTVDQSGTELAKPCTIVGITSVETQEQSHALKFPLGSVLYTVEFADGSDAFLYEEQLETDSTDLG